MISRALKLGRRPRRNCYSFTSKCASNSVPAREKPPKRLHVRSMRTPKTCFMRSGIWRVTIRAFACCQVINRLTINSRWRVLICEDSTVLAGVSLTDLLNSGYDMAETSPENRSDSLSVPWVDTVRFIRQLGHDLRNHLNAIELQSAYISELEGDATLQGEG